MSSLCEGKPPVSPVSMCHCVTAVLPVRGQASRVTCVNVSLCHSCPPCTRASPPCHLCQCVIVSQLSSLYQGKPPVTPASICPWGTDVLPVRGQAPCVTCVNVSLCHSCPPCTRASPS